MLKKVIFPLELVRSIVLRTYSFVIDGKLAIGTVADAPVFEIVRGVPKRGEEPLKLSVQTREVERMPAGDTIELKFSDES